MKSNGSNQIRAKKEARKGKGDEGNNNTNVTSHTKKPQERSRARSVRTLGLTQQSKQNLDSHQDY